MKATPAQSLQWECAALRPVHRGPRGLPRQTRFPAPRRGAMRFPAGVRAGRERFAWCSGRQGRAGVATDSSKKGTRGWRGWARIKEHFIRRGGGARDTRRPENGRAAIRAIRGSKSSEQKKKGKAGGDRG